MTTTAIPTPAKDEQDPPSLISEVGRVGHVHGD